MVPVREVAQGVAVCFCVRDIAGPLRHEGVCPLGPVGDHVFEVGEEAADEHGVRESFWEGRLVVEVVPTSAQRRLCRCPGYADSGGELLVSGGARVEEVGIITGPGGRPGPCRRGGRGLAWWRGGGFWRWVVPFGSWRRGGRRWLA